MSGSELAHIYRAEEIVPGESSIFCAPGISDSPLLPDVKLLGKTAITHSILMRARSRTVRYIRAVHDREMKTGQLESETKTAGCELLARYSISHLHWDIV